MTVKEIVLAYLKQHKYDGLCSEDCGCGIDELMPCASNCENCRPAYKCVHKYTGGEPYSYDYRPEKDKKKKT